MLLRYTILLFALSSSVGFAKSDDLSPFVFYFSSTVSKGNIKWNWGADFNLQYGNNLALVDQWVHNWGIQYSGRDLHFEEFIKDYDKDKLRTHMRERGRYYIPFEFWGPTFTMHNKHWSWHNGILVHSLDNGWDKRGITSYLLLTEIQIRTEDKGKVKMNFFPHSWFGGSLGIEYYHISQRPCLYESECNNGGVVHKSKSLLGFKLGFLVGY